MKIRATLSALGTLVLALGCGGGSSGGGGSTPPPNPAPTQFTVSSPTYIDDLLFSWQTPSAGASSYDLQMKVGSGSYKTQGSAIPGDVTFQELYLPPSVPELTTLSFRLMAEGTYASNEATYFHGLRPLNFGADADTSSNTDVALSWIQTSTVATSTTLERAAWDGSGTLGPYSLIASLAPSKTSYRDPSIQEGVAYQYRLTNLAGTASSQSLVVNSHPIDLLAPRNLSATAQADGSHLQWTNASLIATEVDVYRENQLIAQLPPTATTFVDLAPSVGFHGYSVAAVLGTHGSFTAPALVYDFPPPVAGAPSIQYQDVAVPTSTYLARGNDGRLAAVQSTNIQTYANGTWSNHVLPYTYVDHLYMEGSGYDAQEHLHILYTVPDSSTQQLKLIHESFDGVSWASEVAATGFPGGGRAALTPDGTLLLVWEAYDQVVGQILRIATNVSGAWESSTLPVTLPVGYAPSLRDVAAAQDSSVFVAISAGNPILMHHGPGQASWTQDSPPFPISGSGRIHVSAATEGTYHLFFDASGPLNDPNTQYVYHAKCANGSWSAAEPVAPAVTYVGDEFNSLWTACNTDGSQVALVMNTDHLGLFTWSGQAWVKTPLGSALPQILGYFGCDSAGQFNLYLPGGGYSQTIAFWEQMTF